MYKSVYLLAAILFVFSCRKNSDSTTIEEIPLNIEEYFEFSLNGSDFSVHDLSAWIEDHDTVTVSQIVNFGTGELPQFIFNIHGTGTGHFTVADMTIALDESTYDPNYFKCNGCSFDTEIDYFGENGDYIIGTFEGQVPADGIWYEISGKFASIREN